MLKKVIEIPPFLKNNDLEELLYILRFGIPKKKKTFLELRRNGFNDLPSPVFFLSTGRCGTKWFYSLLKKCKGVRIFHEPKPNLSFQGVMIYSELVKNNFNLEPKIEELYKEIFLVAREQYLRYSYKTDKRYIETNNQITFFAPLLSKIFPNAKFIHVYRHPGEFARSAMRRNFYTSGNTMDCKRIKPLNNSQKNSFWNNYSQLQKTLWLWNETNKFIEKFMSQIDESRRYSFNFNKLNLDSVQNILDFLEISLSHKEIISRISKKTNTQNKGIFPHYSNWPENDKKQLIKICGGLAEKYGYEL
ncbi:MAG: sulfotransferase [Candidatus Helarchaeota archaeon]